MAALLTPIAYSSSKVRLILGGVTAFGFADDSKIVIAKAEDLVLPLEGVDGELSLAVNNKTMGTMTISLQNTSDFNGYLETFAAQATVTGIVAFPVVMEDPAGSSLITTVGWIQTQPDYNVAGEVGTRDWVIGLQDARTQPNSITATVLNGIKGIA